MKLNVFKRGHFDERPAWLTIKNNLRAARPSTSVSRLWRQSQVCH